ncbi:hypothetical protein, partial [Nocardiopsis dassonvillei]|uniref:hypothetical protein n=1 Tax=Nocardiopsis dassonvillei TaxID=2014 RepID=UPI003FD81BBA
SVCPGPVPPARARVACPVAVVPARGLRPADEPASEEAPVDAAGNGVEGVEIATVVGDGIDVHAEPGGGEMLHTLASPNDFGVERTFLVERDEVSLVTTAYRVEVGTGDFAFTVFDGDEEVRTGVIGTGKGETPIPEGHYYFPELLQPPDPEGPYGVYAFGLSGFSETLETLAGGPGQRHQRRGRAGPRGQPRVRPGLRRGHRLDGREPADGRPGRDLRVNRPSPDRRAGRYPVHTDHTRGLPCV